MPSRKRRLKYRLDSLDPVDALELSIGGPSEQLRDLWHRHGARLMREDESGDRWFWPLGQYGAPPGWTLQDERERDARRRETLAGWERSRRQYQEHHVNAEEDR